MNILYKNGRLFGKINIVDFFILTLIFILIPFFFSVYTILGKMPARVPHRWIKVEAITFVTPQFADIFKVGDLSYDESGKPNGRILRISENDRDRAEKLKSAIVKKTNALQYEYRTSVFIEFELLCNRGFENESWYYSRQPLFINLDYGFAFNTSKYSLPCYAIKIKD